MHLPTIQDASRISHKDLIARSDERVQYGHGDSDRVSFRKFLSLARRQMPVLVWTALVIFMLGTAATFLMPRTYVSSTVVKLHGADEALSSRIKGKVASADTDPIAGDPDVMTQIGVITSDRLARRIVANLNLLDNPAFIAAMKVPPTLRTAAGGLDTAKLTAAQLDEYRAGAAAQLLGVVQVDRVGTSYTVAISYRSRSPELSREIANGFADAYIAGQVLDRKEGAAKAATFLAAKVGELEHVSSSDSANLKNYRIDNGLLSTTGTTLTEQDISSYNQQVASARSEAAAAEADLWTARRQLATGSHGDDVGQALSSTVVSGLRSKRAEVASRVAELSATFGPRYPELIAARQNLATIDEQIQAEITRVISNLEAKSNVANQRLSSLEASVASAKGTLAQNNRAMIQMDGLQRRADASQALYQDYLTRYRDVLAQSGIEQPDAEVLIPASLPNMPESPRVSLYLALSGFLALFAGTAVAIARELQFTGITTGSDVETRVELPFLGMIPDNRCQPGRDATALGTLIHQPNSIMAEAMRGLLTATAIPTAGRGSVLAISSAQQDEGKTTVSVMLCLTAARQGIRAVVVDCDIVQRGLSRLCGFDDGPGLLDIARGSADLDAALRTYVESGARVLPITGNRRPGERLTMDGAIQKVVAHLKDRFDLIILDCPPLNVVAEARDVAALADGVVLATRWRRTSIESLRLAARMLPPHLANFTGAVLTMVDLRKQRKFAPDSAVPYGDAYRGYLERAA